MVNIHDISNNDSSLICKELLANSLAPTVSIISSHSADEFVSSNYGYDSFYHLIRPFGANLKSNFNIKNTQLITNTYKSFSIRFSRSVMDVITTQTQKQQQYAASGNNSLELFRPGDLNQIMTEYVKLYNGEIRKLISEVKPGKENDDQNRKINAKTKLLKKSLYLKLISKVYSNHCLLPFECFNHPIIHFIVLTSSDSVETINQILAQNNLNRKKHLLLSPDLRANDSQAIPPDPKVEIPSFLDLQSDDDSLICFLVLVDKSKEGDEAQCDEIKSYVKKNFYYPCLTLKLKDQKDSAPFTGMYHNTDSCNINYEELLQPGIFKSISEELMEFQYGRPKDDKNKMIPFSTNDHNNIINMLIELVKLNLIPFMEKKITYWDDIHVQPRKSITNRFFSASRRYFSNPSSTVNTPSKTSFFGSNAHKPHELTTTVGVVDARTGYYSSNSSEAVTRKLADWAFMLRDYKYAHSTYDLLKKDFNNEKSWTYYASCQEMLVISLLFDLIQQETSSSDAYYNSIRGKLDTIFQTIDSVNYTFLSRSNLKSFVLRFQMTISELFNCLKINTLLEISHSGAGSLLSTSNNIYSIKHLNEIISLKLLTYNIVDNLSSPKKQVLEERSYHLLKALIMERISYSYSVFLFNHSKYLLLETRNLITNLEDVTASVNGSRGVKNSEKTFSVFKKNQDNDDPILLTNPYKLQKANLAVMGLTRYRKAGLWLLLSSNQWEHMNDIVQLKLSLDKCLEMVYGFDRESDGAPEDGAWLRRADGLLGRFIELCENKLNIFDEKLPEIVTSNN